MENFISCAITIIITVTVTGKTKIIIIYHQKDKKEKKRKTEKEQALTKQRVKNWDLERKKKKRKTTKSLKDLRKYQRTVIMRCTNYTGSPLGTGGKLNLHKTFRWHPKRLLNILRAIILHPVPHGEYYNDLAYATCSKFLCNQ